MAIQWTQDLATGVGWQDEQHKELFVRLDNLLEAAKQGKSKDEVGKIVKFLEEYVGTHFGTEERHMNMFAYPDTSSHKQEHMAFVKEFTQLKKDFEKEGASSSIAIQVQRRVTDWLKNHIAKTDKSLGAFLKAKA